MSFTLTPDFVDVAGEYKESTGLSVDELEAMIFAVHARFGEELARKLFTEPGVLPLKDANFTTAALPAEKVRVFIDSLAAHPTIIARELRRSDNGPNDFTVFRKFPLVQQYYNLHLKSAWCGFLMMDNLFLLDKIQTGPYWNANARYGLKLRKFWGSVFERYVNELLRQACAGTKSVFVPDPRRPDNPDEQLCDGIILSDDSIVLLEYKSSMFRADTKYGGDHSRLADEIEQKLVHDRDVNRRKGVLQLAEAVHKIFGYSGCVALPEFDSKKIRRVYLYIVTLDSIGATLGISPFLNTFLEDRLHGVSYSDLEIRPLFCSDIQTLEMITGYLGGSSLAQILERWFSTNPSLATPLLAINLGDLPWRDNPWLRHEWDDMFKRIVRILFPEKNPDAALAEAIAMSHKEGR